MRSLFLLLAVSPLFAAEPAASPAPELPSAEAALQAVKTWREAVAAQSCQRDKKTFQLVCTGEALKTAITPPVWFAAEVNDKDYIEEECAPWSKTKRLLEVRAGDDYDLLMVCTIKRLDARRSEPASIVELRTVGSRLPAPMRKQLQALEATHRFVWVTHKPTSPDPDRFEMLVAVTSDAKKPRIAALYMRVTKQRLDGE